MRNTGLTILWLIFLAGGCAGSDHYTRPSGDWLHLYLVRSDAAEVFLLTSMDGFQPRPARKVGRKLWENIVPADVEFKYVYLVDGNVVQPSCRYREKDDFGSGNCIFVP